ncbi:MAG: oxygen-independent coproporphyrinogen III oxidase [Pseudomonadales bacterium]
MNSHFDPDLIRAYDVNGPRYTSYPTANLFSESFAPDAYTQALRELPDSAPLSLYIHVPFCATICYYCACNKIITNNRRHAIGYLNSLFTEMDLVSSQLQGFHPVEQLHFGGGTPTYLSDAQFVEVFDHLQKRFQLQSGPDRDYSIEIDPRTVTPERIRFLCEIGINRMSLGIQDFDPDVQLAVNRLQSEDDTAAIMRAARDNSVKSISVDLIYGLPKQNPRSFTRTLERVIGLNPDRISLYSYAHLPARFKTQRQINTADLPSPEAKLGLLQLAVETLSAAGYIHIGMDHFARPEDELVKAQADGSLHRNFQGYTTHGHCELVGLGVSAISSISNRYCQNAKSLPDYTAALASGRLPVERGLLLTGEDTMIREIIGDLMCHFTLDVRALEASYGDPGREVYESALPALRPLAEDGLVELLPGRLNVTERGRYLIRNVCMVFDRHLPVATTSFSKAI